MEETSKEEKGEISSSTKASAVDISATYPCSLFTEAIKALLKCLGFGDSSTPASDTDHQTPPSTSVVDGGISTRAANTRPPIKRGRNPPQNN